MIRRILLILAALGSHALFSQEIRLTFTGTGEATVIDSVRATNLSTGQSITIPGGAILVLGAGSGTGQDAVGPGSVVLFPNPFSGETNLALTSAIQQSVVVLVRNMAGQLVVQEQARLDPGTALFSVVVRVPGFYTVTVSGDKISLNAKMLCTGSGSSSDAIRNIGTINSDGSGMLLKTAGYLLGFSPGDIIEFAVMSGNRTTIFTDSPSGSHNYPVELVGCSDNSGNSYPVVMIGDQTWMGRNLALLPSVSPSETGSDDSPVYYVFGYEGSNTAAAKDIAEYTTYGVLYNWQAARISCPEGWSLPTDADWQILEKYLGMGYDEAAEMGWRSTGGAGGKLKESGLIHWARPNLGASDLYGFSALPGSCRSQYPGFYNLGYRGYFWTSTQNGGRAWYRAMINETGAIDRGLIGFEYGFSVRCLKGGGQSVELPSVTTAAVTGITKVSAISGGTVTSDGGAQVIQRGICWNSGGNPDINGEHTTDDSGLGVFVSNITGLTAATPYYVRAYATNSAGTAYGAEIQFTTESVDELPVVTTSEISAVTKTTATGGGTVAFEGNTPVTARGLCWNTKGLPVATDPHTVDGTGTGIFTSSLSGLTAGTPYYVRAYATNSFGTAYGEQRQFTTSQVITIPEVTTADVTGITGTTATGGGNITADGGAEVSARGLCWNTTGNPDVTGNKTSDGAGTGIFTSSLTGLFADSTYFVRAYATNSVGTGYGEQKQFHTSDSVRLPTVTTKNVSEVTITSATCGGDISSDGGAPVIARGVCWSGLGEPAITDGITHDGTGVGSFISHMDTLFPTITYYVRAYATNSAGTAYGETRLFTALDPEGTAKDPRTGRIYRTVKIGTKTWIAENMDWLPQVSPPGVEQENGYAYWVFDYHGYNVAEAKATANYQAYGVLYNAQTAGWACPVFYTLPSEEEAKNMVQILGGESVAGGKLKETGTQFWQSPNTGATNETGFGARGAGFNFLGTFTNLGYGAYFWTGTPLEWEFKHVYSFDLSNQGADVQHKETWTKFGLSVRCIRTY